MALMSDPYRQLLDATIRHLQDLKSRGVRYVPATPEALAALNQIPAAPVAKKFDATSPQAQPAPVPARPAPKPAHTPAPAPAKPSAAPEAKSTALDLSLGLPGETAAVAAPPLGPEAKIAAFTELRERAMACVKCPHLASSRKTVVFGVGNINAELMFVGEAPGADEDELGEPFVGRAGQLLTKIIQAMGLQRGDVYIANILKCRPDTPGQTAGNRKPTADEMSTCIPYLHEQIDLIRPRVLVALGATAVEGLLGKTAGITRLRGNWQTYRGTPLMPTVHPAYLLRNQAASEKRKIWEDMMLVMDKLAMPISAKQRGFFLK